MRVVLPICSAIITDGDKYLLVQSGRNQHSYNGKWGLPGGKIDPGESPKEAVQRELYQETGLLVRNLGLFRIYCSVPGTDSNLWVINFAYKGDFVGAVKEPDGEEILKIGWFSYDQIVGMDRERLIRTTDNMQIITESMDLPLIHGLEKKILGSF